MTTTYAVPKRVSHIGHRHAANSHTYRKCREYMIANGLPLVDKGIEPIRAGEGYKTRTQRSKEEEKATPPPQGDPHNLHDLAEQVIKQGQESKAEGHLDAIPVEVPESDNYVKIGDLSSLTESLMSAVDNLAQYAEVQRVTVALVFDGRPIKARYISTTGEWEVAL